MGKITKSDYIWHCACCGKTITMNISFYIMTNGKKYCLECSKYRKEPEDNENAIYSSNVNLIKSGITPDGYVEKLIINIRTG